MRKRSFLFFILLTAVLTWMPAEEKLAGLEAVGAYALEHNLTYRTAVWDALKARNNLEGLIKLEYSSLSFSGTWDDFSAEQVPDVETSLALPVLEQAAVNASLGSDLRGRLGLVLNPLAHSSTDEKADLAYRKALAYAEETALTVENDTVSALLQWSAVEQKADTQERLTALKEQLYQDEKTRYTAGESTLDDVRDALKGWSEARVQLTSLQNQRQQALTNLYTLLNTEPTRVSVTAVGMEELRSSLESLRGRINTATGNPSAVWKVESARMDTEGLQIELDNTWLIDPTVSINAGLDIDMSGAGFQGAGGSVTLSLGLQDLRKKEREELARDISLAEEQVVLATAESTLAYKQAQGALENATLTEEIVELELEETRELVDEATFLYEQGDISETELEEAQLLLVQAENEYFSALAEEYIALLELERYTYF